MEMLVLNRQNTMVYFDGKEVLIRNYFKKISLTMTKDEYDTLLKIMVVTKEECSIEALSQEISVEQERIIKLLKILHQIGSILLYSNSNSKSLKYYQKKKWFEFVTQYLPPSENVHKACQKLDAAEISISDKVNEIFPKMKKVFRENDLQNMTQEEVEQANHVWKLDMSSSENKENQTIVLSLSQDKLIGKKTVSGDPLDELPTKADAVPSERSLLYKVGPIYTMIYVVKTILGISEPFFSINEEGTFAEYNLNKDKWFQSTQDIVFHHDQANKRVNDLEKVSKFEEFLHLNKIPLRISGLDCSYEEIYQMGLATYALTNKGNGKTFVYAGLNYVETANQSIQKGLEYFLSDEENEGWIVTNSSEYYLRKALFMLEKIEESYELYHLSGTEFENSDGVKYMRSLKHHLNIYCKKFNESNSFTIYVHDVDSDRLYTDGKRTIDLDSKISELIWNVVLLKENQGQQFVSVLKDDEKLLCDIRKGHVKSTGTLFKVQPTDFIDESLRLLESRNFKYEEESWKFEDNVRDSDLLVRKIEVSSY
ncbi:hypothetical protein ACI2JA_08040 [Alkalihalobacillus sp. NPDC078783]